MTDLHIRERQDPDNAVFEALGVTRHDQDIIFSVNRDPDDVQFLPNDVSHEYSINTDDELKSGSAANVISPKSLRHWLVVPICILFFGGYLTSFFTIQQFVYRKIQEEKFPNATFNNSIPICEVNKTNPDYILQTEAQQESATWMMYLGLASGIPSVFANLILGSYTDKYGRKYLFYLPCIGSLISMIINAVGIHANFQLTGLIPTFILSGLTGNVFVIVLVTFTYIADITQPGPSRTFRITVVELALGLGAAGFSVLAGYIVQAFTVFSAMATACVCIALALVLVVFLPETFTKDKRTAVVSTCDGVRNAFKLFFGKENAGKRWMYNVLISAFIFARLIDSEVEPLYQMNAPFCWDPEQLSWYMALTSAWLLAGMIITTPLQSLFSDEAIALIGCVSFMIRYTIEALANNSAMLYFANVTGFLGVFIIPMLRGVLSRLTAADKQGAMFASIASVETLSSVVAAVIANVVYEKTVGFFKGFVFLLFAAYYGISLALLVIFRLGYARHEGKDYSRLEIRT